MQSTFKHIRIQILTFLFDTCLAFYSKHFKRNRKAWNITKNELTQYPKESLGYQLGVFLQNNKFDLMPKLENHDCFHIITNYPAQVKDEIALQYLCLGNGERSFSSLLVIITGTILLPEYFNYYVNSFRKGKQYKPFYHLEYQNLLHQNINSIKNLLK